MSKNFGIKVSIKFTKDSKYSDKSTVLRNVTEIHYNKIYYNYQTSLSENHVAFESHIHRDGCTYLISDIQEFETALETKKEAAF